VTLPDRKSASIPPASVGPAREVIKGSGSSTFGGSGASLAPHSRPLRTRRRRVWIAIGAVIVVGAVAVFAIVPRLLANSSSNCNPPVPPGWSDGQTFVLASCGTALSLPADSYTSYQAVRLSDGEILLGQYTANATVGAYLLNSSEFSKLLTAPHPTAPPPASFWTCGEVTVCAVQADVPPSPALYILVLENLNSASVSVVWTHTLLIYYTATPVYVTATAVS